MLKYCDLFFRVLHPVHKNSKNQTTTKWRSPTPDFHEQFVYSSSASDLAKQSLYVTVWHKSCLGPKACPWRAKIGQIGPKGRQRRLHWRSDHWRAKCQRGQIAALDRSDQGPEHRPQKDSLSQCELYRLKKKSTEKKNQL